MKTNEENVLKKLMDKSRKELEFLIEQKDILESTMTDKEKEDPLIQAKLRSLNRKIKTFQEELDKLAEVCKKTAGKFSETYENYKNSIAKNTDSYMS